jgi:predicted lipoprotein
MSINTDALKTALKGLNIPFGKQIRYADVAKALNYEPKKFVKGKETKQKLTVGGQKYKEAVYNEVIRRRQAKEQSVKKVKEEKVIDKVIDFLNN